MTLKAIKAIQEAHVIAGYSTYVDLIGEMIGGREIIAKGMMQEVERARLAVAKVLEGKKVAIVSSGDAGIYAMASVVLEYLHVNDIDINVEIIPGITAASSAAALLGSPLGHDFAVISLSDLLTPWQIIEKRIELAAKGDFNIVLYNPKSKKRTKQIERCREIMMEYKDDDTPVGIVKNAMRDGEKIIITTLNELPLFYDEIDMLSTVIIGNMESFVFNNWIVTPRGYKKKYGLSGKKG